MTLAPTAERIFALLDLTSLNQADDPMSIGRLCGKASFPPKLRVAALCVWPRLIRSAKDFLKNAPKIKIATVINFPEGTGTLDAILFEAEKALEEGADEIDVVMPYAAFLEGKRGEIKALCRTLKRLSPNVPLKAILETGAVQKALLIRQMTEEAITGGADFIKTSTGKTPQSATLEAANVILETIRAEGAEKSVGFKASGGLRTVAQAADYLKLADAIMGEKWVSPATFRFGASALADDIVKILTGEESAPHAPATGNY